MFWKIDGSFESFNFFHFEPKYIENATNSVSSLETSISVKNVNFCFYALERAFLNDIWDKIKGLTLPELLILKHFWSIIMLIVMAGTTMQKWENYISCFWFTFLYFE